MKTSSETEKSPKLRTNYYVIMSDEGYYRITFDGSSHRNMRVRVTNTKSIIRATQYASRETAEKNLKYACKLLHNAKIREVGLLPDFDSDIERI